MEFLLNKLSDEDLTIHMRILDLLEGKSYLAATSILEAAKQTLSLACIVTIPSFPADPL